MTGSGEPRPGRRRQEEQSLTLACLRRRVLERTRLPRAMMSRLVYKVIEDLHYSILLASTVCSVQQHQRGSNPGPLGLEELVSDSLYNVRSGLV